MLDICCSTPGCVAPKCLRDRLHWGKFYRGQSPERRAELDSLNREIMRRLELPRQDRDAKTKTKPKLETAEGESETPMYTDVPLLKKAGVNFRNSVNELLEARLHRERLDSRIASLSEDIRQTLKKAGAPRVEFDNGVRLAAVAPGIAKSFSKEVARALLVEKGVPAKVVEKVWEKATTEAPKSGYLKVTLPRDRK